MALLAGSPRRVWGRREPESLYRLLRLRNRIAFLMS